MGERSQSPQNMGSAIVLVGVFTDQRSGLDKLVPAISNLGWRIVEFDPWSESSGGSDDINLIVFSLASVGTEALEKISEAALDQANILVVSDDRDPQIIADVLRSGADDYLASPFDTAELEARMHSLVTRVWPSTDRRTSTGISFDFETRTIAAGPFSVRFTPLEWDVLVVLMEHDGAPVSADVVARELDARGVQPSTVPTIVSRIRRRLDANNFQAVHVTTLQNRGYVAQFRRASDQWVAKAPPNPTISTVELQPDETTHDGATREWRTEPDERGRRSKRSV